MIRARLRAALAWKLRSIARALDRYADRLRPIKLTPAPLDNMVMVGQGKARDPWPPARAHPRPLASKDAAKQAIDKARQ